MSLINQYLTWIVILKRPMRCSSHYRSVLALCRWWALRLLLPQSHGLHNQTEQPSGLNTGESARNAADLDASQNLDRPSQGTELQAPPTSSISDNHSTPLPTYPFSRSPRRSSRGSTLHEYHRTLMEMEIERRRTAPASYSPENVFRSHPVPPRAQRVRLQKSGTAYKKST